MTSKTPWSDQVSAAPQGFGFRGRGDHLTITINSAASCALHVPTRSIYQQNSGSTTVWQVQPFRWDLQPWDSAEVRMLHAHPYLVLHLLATGQVDANELITRMTPLGSRVARAVIAITQPCELLSMLRLPRVGLLLGTNFDLGLGQR